MLLLLLEMAVQTWDQDIDLIPRTCPPQDAEDSMSSCRSCAGMTAGAPGAALPGRGGCSYVGSTRGATTKSKPHSRYSCMHHR
jgi:hypothetical protein